MSNLLAGLGVFARNPWMEGIRDSKRDFLLIG